MTTGTLWRCGAREMRAAVRMPRTATSMRHDYAGAMSSLLRRDCTARSCAVGSLLAGTERCLQRMGSDRLWMHTTRQYAKSRGDGGVPALAKYRVNKEIPGSLNVLYVGTGSGSAPRVMPAADALREAQAAGLDLVEIAPDAKTPVCKLMDFEAALQSARQKLDAVESQSKKASKAKSMKELRLTPTIQQHDFEVKMKRVREWLEAGLRVRIFMMFKRGQAGMSKSAFKVLNQAKETLANEAAVVSETTEAEQRALDEQRKEQKLPPKSLPLELVLAPSSKPKP